MTVTGILTALVIGLVVGALGRLVVPGRQRIGLGLTLLVGVVAALLGTALARGLGIATTTAGIDWIEVMFQVALAAVGVVLVANLMSRRRRHVRR